MGHMMLQVMKRHGQIGFRNMQQIGKDCFYIADSLHAAQTVQSLVGKHQAIMKDEGNIVYQVRIRDLRDPDMGDVLDLYPGPLKTVLYGQRRETRGMFHTIETLFFDRSHDPAVFQQHRGCIRMIRVNPQYVCCHPTPSDQFK
jgi:hypothetical protein